MNLLCKCVRPTSSCSQPGSGLQPVYMGQANIPCTCVRPTSGLHGSSQHPVYMSQANIQCTWVRPPFRVYGSGQHPVYMGQATIPCTRIMPTSRTSSCSQSDALCHIVSWPLLAFCSCLLSILNTDAPLPGRIKQTFETRR